LLPKIAVVLRFRDGGPERLVQRKIGARRRVCVQLGDIAFARRAMPL